MKRTVNFSDFCDAFVDANRDNSFSYEGKQALFTYFEEYERDTDQEIELETSYIIAFCSEYSEYASAQEVMDQYQIGIDDLGIDNPIDLAIEQIEEYISDNDLDFDLSAYADVKAGHNKDTILDALQSLGKTTDDLGIELDPDDDELLEALEEYLLDHTQVVCCTSDCILIADY